MESVIMALLSFLTLAVCISFFSSFSVQLEVYRFYRLSQITGFILQVDFLHYFCFLFLLIATLLIFSTFPGDFGFLLFSFFPFLMMERGCLRPLFFFNISPQCYKLPLALHQWFPVNFGMFYFHFHSVQVLYTI